MNAEPSTAGTLSPSATVDALRESCVIRWWQTTTFVEVEGADAITFLEGLCTQHVATIAEGSARIGMFLTNKAKIIAATMIWRLADREGAPRILLELDPARVDDLQSHLKKFRLRARVRMSPIERSTIALHGRGAPHHPVAAGEGWFDLPDAGTPVRAFVGDDDQVTVLMRDTLPALGLAPADPDALDAVRIASGTPSIDDLLVGRMPAEVGGVDVGVALDKGCYLGQEPVARLHWRGQSQRSLRTCRLSDDLPAGCDLDVFRADDEQRGRAVGRVTTWAHDAGGEWVALAMLRRDVEPGVELVVGSSGIRIAA